MKSRPRAPKEEKKNMTLKRVQKKIAWSPADIERHNVIRKVFKDKPTIEKLIARGELSGQTVPLGTYLNLKVLIRELRKLRERAKLSLTDLSKKSGMDKAMLSRLENGHVLNPGIGTISRYMNALDKDIEWRIVEGIA
jgi:DNA-binding Xre family transcriptional regulator